jgi:hypothetical protein
MTRQKKRGVNFINKGKQSKKIRVWKYKYNGRNIKKNIKVDTM